MKRIDHLFGHIPIVMNVTHSIRQTVHMSEHMNTLTCALGEIGDVSVVKDHLIFQQVSQSTQARSTHDAYQGT